MAGSTAAGVEFGLLFNEVIAALPGAEGPVGLLGVGVELLVGPLSLPVDTPLGWFVSMEDGVSCSLCAERLRESEIDVAEIGFLLIPGLFEPGVLAPPVSWTLVGVGTKGWLMAAGTLDGTVTGVVA